MDTRVTRNVAADPRTSLAMWLRAGRAQRKLTLDDVARVTKIQPRILEKIEAGNLEGLPAEGFVRGFVKSFARCVGLDESEAVERYGQCANATALPTTSVARAFVETLVAAPKAEKSANANATPVMLEAPPEIVPPEILPSASIEMAPIEEHPDVVAHAAEIEIAPPAPAIEVIEVIEAAQVEEAPKKKRSRKKANGATPNAAPRSRKKKSAAAGTGSSPVVVETQAVETVAPHVVEIVETKSAPAETPISDEAGPDAPLLAAAIEPLAPEVDLDSAADQLFAPSDGIVIEQQIAEGTHGVEDSAALADDSTPVVADPWQPTMPPIAASVPWKRPTATFKTTVSPYALPSLVIDDADPDNAEREREDREIAKGPHRVAFLPQILLDREDKSGRQGGLTLAVILLLIAATLTLSYLMRRPSVSGDGVTQAHVDTTEIIA
jgi:hypothetical protein